jgi:hypothetical protein
VLALDSKLKNLENTIKEVKKEAAAAAARATTANNAAEDVKGKLTKLYQANATLRNDSFLAWPQVFPRSQQSYARCTPQGWLWWLHSTGLQALF